MQEDSTQEEYAPSFEIVLQVRDSKGNLTGKTKTFASDSAEKLAEFYSRNSTKPKRKRRTDGPLPTAKEADKILKDVFQGEAE